MCSICDCDATDLKLDSGLGVHAQNQPWTGGATQHVSVVVVSFVDSRIK